MPSWRRWGEDRMRLPIQLPQLGYDQEAATIAGWLKKVGETWYIENFE